jgi:hypothetical protein
MQYECVLFKSPDPEDPFGDLEKLGPLTGVTQQTCTVTRNRAGSASFVLRTNSDSAKEILDRVDLNDVRGTVRKCIKVRRTDSKGNKKTIWSGPIWGIQGSLDQGTMTVSCVGWLESLVKKILYSTQDFSNKGYGTPADEIAFALMRVINGQYLSRANIPDAPLWVKEGSVFGGPLLPRNRYYTIGQQLGDALQNMSDVEAGYDYMVDPDTRELNLYNWNYYSTREDVIFGYRKGPDNLKTFSWTEDASQTCNSMIVISQGAPVGPIYDADSQRDYGVFEEYNTLSGAQQTILAAYAGAELAIRSVPLLTYSVAPYSNSSPKIFEDYDIGDAAYLSAEKDYFKLERQKIRIFGATLNFDDNGNEQVSSLAFSPTGD